MYTYILWSLITTINHGTPNKMKVYLGIVIHMGLSQSHEINLHWTPSTHYSCTFCANIMSRNEFTLLHRFFHITNNKIANTNDKMNKIRPLFDLLALKFQNFYVLKQDITIDERMVKYTGRLSFRQYIRDNP